VSSQILKSDVQSDFAIVACCTICELQYGCRERARVEAKPADTAAGSLIWARWKSDVESIQCSGPRSANASCFSARVVLVFLCKTRGNEHNPSY